MQVLQSVFGFPFHPEREARFLIEQYQLAWWQIILILFFEAALFQITFRLLNGIYSFVLYGYAMSINLNDFVFTTGSIAIGLFVFSSALYLVYRTLGGSGNFKLHTGLLAVANITLLPVLAIVITFFSQWNDSPGQLIFSTILFLIALFIVTKLVSNSQSIVHGISKRRAATVFFLAVVLIAIASVVVSLLILSSVFSQLGNVRT